MIRPRAPRARVRRTLAAGLGLALAITLFLDVAVLVVPVYDMQLYDRVLQSRNMDTLAFLSVACVVGLVIYGMLEYLRGACFVALGEAVGRLLDGVVLEEGIRRAAAGDRAAGPGLVRDLLQVQGFLASGAVAVPLDALCTPLFLAVLFMLHPGFGWFGLGGVSVLVMCGLLTDRLSGRALVAAQARRSASAQALSQTMAAPELSEALGMMPAIARRWAARHGAALAALDRASARALLMGGLSRLVRLLVQTGVMFVGAIIVVSGAATPGSLMGANLLTAKLVAPFDALVSSWRGWALAIAAWRRLDAALIATAPPAAAAPPGLLSPGLALSNVSLRTAEGRTLLHGIDFVLAPGTLAVVVGPNGAGKTTLLRLLAGLMPPTSGEALLDGAPLHGGSGVGYLPQAVALMDGTVGENIGRFRDAGLEAAIEAARRADVHEAVGRMAWGYDTGLANDGRGLSGGMRQRVGLARALLGAPRLLVLDEPDANLDAEGTAALLRAVLQAREAGAIVVVTSHRAALQSKADVVIALRDGTLDHALDHALADAPKDAPVPAQLATA